MPRTALTPVDIPEDYTVTGVTPTWTASDVANGNSVPCTGREILLVRNDAVGPQTITVDSSVDPQDRTGDITAVSIAAAAYWASQMFPVLGWKQSDGNLYIDGSDAGIMLCVIKIP